MPKVYFTFLFVCLIGHVNLAQQIPSFEPPQPASLGRYGPDQMHIPGNHPANPIQYLEAQKERVSRQNEAMIQEANAMIAQEQQRKRMQQEMALHREIEASFPDIARERATAYAKNCYQAAYRKLLAMLEGQVPQSIKRAVYTVENAFLMNRLDSATFENQIQKLAAFTREKLPAYQAELPYPQAANLALFHTLFDTLPNPVGTQVPIRYDFADYLGQADHRQLFVSKLLQTGTGQCHSMPLLYLILAEEVGAEAYWSFAPSHSFIQHRDREGNWQFVELTSGNYVSEMAMARAGYIKAAALKNRIYLDTLSRSQSIATCLLDLSHGYQWRFGVDEFVIQCCQQSLKYYPNNIAAYMTLANAYFRQEQQAAVAAGVKNAEEAMQHPKLAPLVQKRRKLYGTISEMGHVPMPKEEYEAWLRSLQGAQQKQECRRILNQMQAK